MALFSSRVRHPPYRHRGRGQCLEEEPRAPRCGGETLRTSAPARQVRGRIGRGSSDALLLLRIFLSALHVIARNLRRPMESKVTKQSLVKSRDCFVKSNSLWSFDFPRNEEKKRNHGFL